MCPEGVLEVRAPAKINLFLEVLGKRADGYHEIRSLVVPVAVYDELRLQAVDGGIRLFETASVFAEVDDGEKFGRQTIEHRNLALVMDAPAQGKKNEQLQAAIRMVRGAVESVAGAVGGAGVRVDVEATDRAIFCSFVASPSSISR